MGAFRTQSPHSHQHQVRKELAAEPFERFTKLLDKLKVAKSMEEALLCLLQAQARLCYGVCQLRCYALAAVIGVRMDPCIGTHQPIVGGDLGPYFENEDT